MIPPWFYPGAGAGTTGGASVKVVRNRKQEANFPCRCPAAFLSCALTRSPPASPPGASRSPNVASIMRALLVVHDASCREILASVLARRGWHTATHESTDALEAFRESGPDDQLSSLIVRADVSEHVVEV